MWNNHWQQLKVVVLYSQRIQLTVVEGCKRWMIWQYRIKLQYTIFLQLFLQYLQLSVWVLSAACHFTLLLWAQCCLLLWLKTATIKRIACAENWKCADKENHSCPCTDRILPAVRRKWYNMARKGFTFINIPTY